MSFLYHGFIQLCKSVEINQGDCYERKSHYHRVYKVGYDLSRNKITNLERQLHLRSEHYL